MAQAFKTGLGICSRRGMGLLLVVVLLTVFGGPALQAGEPVPLPAGFVDVQTVIPDLLLDLRYLGSENFLGCPVEGYEGVRCILTRQAAAALARVREELRPFGLNIKVYDAFRPQRAVDHFVRWASDPGDVKMKAAYYPQWEKERLIPDGFIAARSSHSRGSTVDLTLVDQSGRDLDMGTRFDWFGSESRADAPGMGMAQRAHRMLLRLLMEKHGFAPYEAEWWHFTLREEPYPDTYFDFPVR